MTKIAVIIGSTRKGRVSDRFAQWIAKAVAEQAEVEVVDLKDYPLPLFDEEGTPRYNPDRHPAPAVQKWLDKIGGFDGYIMVTPEYNRAMPGVLKNAIDLLDYQLEQKPVALAGHGSIGGGQAVATLRLALPGVGAITIPEALYFAHRVRDVITPENELVEELRQAPVGPQGQLAGVIHSLVWYAEALKAARATQGTDLK